MAYSPIGHERPCASYCCKDANRWNAMKRVVEKALRRKRYHKWPGLIVAVLMLFYSVSGILLNHRWWLSGNDVPRRWLPEAYAFKDWNNAALKGDCRISPDSLLLYGKSGIWLQKGANSTPEPFVKGFPEGAARRAVFDVHQSSRGHLYAATQFGLYAFRFGRGQWQRLPLPGHTHERIVAIATPGDSLVVLSRSFVFTGKDRGHHTQFTRHTMLAPENYTQEISLFKTLWQIHSGEVFGLPGQLFVDLLGLVMLLLSLTGIVYFFVPGWLRRRKARRKSFKKWLAFNKFSLHWHNRLGVWFVWLLAVLTLTGIFLRPPLLIAIARAHIAPIPFTHLDQANPWYDKLRDIHYESAEERFYLSTSEGMFYWKNLSARPRRCPTQPPVSVMGITVFERYGNRSFLIGSFSGLFVWEPQSGFVWDAIADKPYVHTGGRPVGRHAITGLVHDRHGRRYYADYETGLHPLDEGATQWPMPKAVAKVEMPLWHLALEVHTGRFFEFLLGDFYILLVPLTGLTTLVVLISGYMLWRVRFRKKRRK